MTQSLQEKTVQPSGKPTSRWQELYPNNNLLVAIALDTYSVRKRSG
ncbi:MAG TPA: hypothetical protein V6C91_19345 [Coleofasciculaceae cyanobacterium]